MAVGFLVLALGCGGGKKASSVANAAPAMAAATPIGTATITGEVKFVGKAPANPGIDMTEEPKCKADYQTTPHQPIVVVNSNETLANVFVYVKSGLPTGAKYPPPSTPVTIDQKGCMYHPHVFGIVIGQPLSIENSDGILHNIKVTGHDNRPFNISQPAVMTTERPGFTAPEVMLPVECNVHSWMHAYVGVLPHPFFSTTGADGKFTIKALPAGTYTIEAWQEKYGTRTATVTVHDGESKTVDFVYPAVGV
jgi:hypothetical protein